MSPNHDDAKASDSVSLTQFIDANQRVLAVLSVFVAVIVVSGQIESSWATVFRGTFVLLALIVWLELIANYLAVARWTMPRHSSHPGAWLGPEQRMYWFGVLAVIGFVLFCAYLLVTYPVTSFYVVLAILHAPLHVVLFRWCLTSRVVQRTSERATIALASVLSGAMTLLVLAAVVVSLMVAVRAVR
jgi:hypothetical protein